MPNPKPSSKKSLEEMWAAAANAAALMSLEQTTGMTLSDPSDAHGSLNALLAAARSQNSTLTRPPMLKSKRRSPSSKSVAVLANREVLIAAAQAAGVSLSSPDPSDPLFSKNNQDQVSTLTKPPMSRSRRRPSSSKSAVEASALANVEALMGVSLSPPDPSDPRWPQRSRQRPSLSKSAVGATGLANREVLMAPAQAAGVFLSSPDPLDPRWPQRSRRQPSSSKSALGARGLANPEVLMAAAQAAGVSLSPLDPSDPRCSKNNLLEPAQAQVSTLTRPQDPRSRPSSKSSTVGAAALGNHEAKQGQLQIPPWAKGLLDLIPTPIKRAKKAPSKVQEKASTTSYDLDCGEGKGY